MAGGASRNMRRMLIPHERRPHGRLRRDNRSMRQLLSPEEYRLLSDQKAADYRSFLQLNPGLLAVTGAIFAAGLSQDSTIAIVMSPLPLLLAVFQLVRNAELQLQLATYLAVFSPVEGGNWERDVAAVRPLYWAQQSGPAKSLRRPSSWNVWIIACFIVAEMIVVFPWLSHLAHGQRAFIIASVCNLLASGYLVRTSDRIERERKKWTELWTEYRNEPLEPTEDGL